VEEIHTNRPKYMNEFYNEKIIYKEWAGAIAWTGMKIW
jgi:hypothetical protein